MFMYKGLFSPCIPLQISRFITSVSRTCLFVCNRNYFFEKIYESMWQAHIICERLNCLLLQFNTNLITCIVERVVYLFLIVVKKMKLFIWFRLHYSLLRMWYTCNYEFISDILVWRLLTIKLFLLRYIQKLW